MIQLSNRQAKEADRVGGIELMILWPAALGAPPVLSRDHQSDARPGSTSACYPTKRTQ